MPAANENQGRVYPLVMAPGIRRDGTLLDGADWTAGLWTRFDDGRPESIGGYRRLNDQLSGPISQLHIDQRNGLTTIHSGHPGGIEQIYIDSAGGVGAINSRAAGSLSATGAYRWQFCAAYDATSTQAMLIAHAAPNANIDNTTTRNVYFGSLTATTALATSSATGSFPAISGGVCAAHPFVFYYSHDGFVTWGGANAPQNLSTATDGTGGGGSSGARVAYTKIVRGYPLRGGAGNSPAALFWSLNTVIRSAFTGGQTVFRFDTVADDTSILSSNAVVPYDGMFFWPGIDRFLMYNGTVREVPNKHNRYWFFRNLNFDQRQKVFGFKVPAKGEIWWCFPYGDNTDCSHAVILNVRDNTWYDTELPSDFRTAGAFVPQYQYPLLTGGTANSSSKYSLWQHEDGADRIEGGDTIAIRKFIESGVVTFQTSGPIPGGWSGLPVNTRIHAVEPDMEQTGNMTLTVIGRKYARASESESEYTFASSTQKISVQGGAEQHRQMRLRFESNMAGGSFRFGQNLLHLTEGAGRP